MRYFIALFLALTIGMANADEIRCYQNGKLIYHHYMTDMSYEDGVFAFKEANTEKVVFTSMECIGKVDL
jgi:hypothetical protein